MAAEEENTTGSDGTDSNDSLTQARAAGAASRSDSLMTRVLGEGEDDKDEGGEGKDGRSDDRAKDADKKPPDPSEKVPDKPEDYKFKFADGVQVDTELLTGFRKAAHDLGLSMAKAQKLAGLYEAHAAKAGERARAEQQKYLDDARKQWEAEIEKSPGFTRDREHIQATLREFGDEELYTLLNQTNLGSHPKMWAFMAKVGKALAEPAFKGGNPGGEKSAAEVLYPNQGKTGAF